MTTNNQKVLVPVAIVITTREFDEFRNDYVTYISHGIDIDTGYPFLMQQEPVGLNPDIKFSEVYNEYVLMGEKNDDY